MKAFLFSGITYLLYYYDFCTIITVNSLSLIQNTHLKSVGPPELLNKILRQLSYFNLIDWKNGLFLLCSNYSFSNWLHFIDLFTFQ